MADWVVFQDGRIIRFPKKVFVGQGALRTFDGSSEGLEQAQAWRKSVHLDKVKRPTSKQDRIFLDV